MAYKLKKPYNDRQRMNFIVQYNHNQSLEIAEGTEYLYALLPNEIMVDGVAVINPEYEAEQERKEAERIAQLNMTRGDFIEGLILALGKDENDVIALIETLPITDVEKKVYINRVKNALDFYRGYPVIDVLCGYLGLTTEQMTHFFETKDWKCLLVKTDEELPTEEVVDSEEPIEGEENEIS